MSYNLLDLNRNGLPKLTDGLENAESWHDRRKEIERVWLDEIGGVPDRVPVSYEVLDEAKEADHTRIRLVYDTVYGDKVSAFLLLPDESVGGAGADGRRPGLLALHPTHESGKADVAVPNGRANRGYGVELVSRGYVVLAPDALTAGERIYPGLQSFRSMPFYERHPDWSTVGKNAIDHIQGVDLLRSLDGVDADRIGAIGHSFGGYNAYFLAGLDSRIRAYVSSCGFSPFYGDRQPTHWGERDWYTHLPRISGHLSRYEVPFEFHEIAALAAPVPAFHYYGQNDRIFPHWQAVGACMAELDELYRFLGAGDRFQAYMTAGGHDFPPEIRGLAYAFLDRWLKGPSGQDEGAERHPAESILTKSPGSATLITNITE
ncbi:alpha/beta hydrolase family protein [Paenibacillus flagellatus]|uniref:Dipeptidyl aminopeptidase n=1 Tax=Paenibacillus flagellatus TaxID=2211139 RepID=A0A2V5KED2_9BACL|nr:prolyl oligopeptidase family serine peptidase [Paenibacillus flagellatus]PYI57442.1 dipeptidyl aminopeptidase [Paenibacillus flagellatus]